MNEDRKYICSITGITNIEIGDFEEMMTLLRIPNVRRKKELVEELKEDLCKYGNTIPDILIYFREHLTNCIPCQEEYKMIEGNTELGYILAQEELESLIKSLLNPN